MLSVRQGVGGRAGSFREGSSWQDLGGSYWLRMWKHHPPMVTDQAALLCLGNFRGQLDIFNLGGTVKRKLGYPMQKLLSRKPN